MAFSKFLKAIGCCEDVLDLNSNKEAIKKFGEISISSGLSEKTTLADMCERRSIAEKYLSEKSNEAAKDEAAKGIKKVEPGKDCTEIAQQWISEWIDFYALLKEKEEEEGKLIKEFFDNFSKNNIVYNASLLLEISNLSTEKRKLEEANKELEEANKKLKEANKKLEEANKKITSKTHTFSRTSKKHMIDMSSVRGLGDKNGGTGASSEPPAEQEKKPSSDDKGGSATDVNVKYVSLKSKNGTLENVNPRFVKDGKFKIALSKEEAADLKKDGLWIEYSMVGSKFI